MKKANKKPDVTINIFSNNSFTLDGKSFLSIMIAIFLLSLVASDCDSTALAEIIRSLISIADNC